MGALLHMVMSLWFRRREADDLIGATPYTGT